jgi:two-component system response regulator HydG
MGDERGFQLGLGQVEARTSVANGALPRVLLVDDERDLLDVLAQELGDMGFDVTALDNGRAALDAVGRRRFDALITDLKMPGMDGLEMLRLLKQTDPHLPVIVITGYASDRARRAFDAREAYGLLLKPFTLEDMRRLVEAAVTRRPDLDGSGRVGR